MQHFRCVEKFIPVAPLTLLLQPRTPNWGVSSKRLASGVWLRDTFGRPARTNNGCRKLNWVRTVLAGNSSKGRISTVGFEDSYLYIYIVTPFLLLLCVP